MASDGHFGSHNDGGPIPLAQELKLLLCRVLLHSIVLGSIRMVNMQ